ncbi:MAG: Gldg family protein [Thiotrichales bacterium]
MRNVFTIARKELATLFASPAAFVFLGVFLLASLFVLFWVETFFARNIADARPLFEWMPVLLIFLVAALTMRLWSEERRMGTLELLLTAPVNTLAYVVGKFLACLALVAIALTLTLPVPVTVALLGPLDWGPVFGAYLAALVLAAAYIAIGLFVSARTDNQVVSLIVTVLICGVFYLLGAEALTHLVGTRGAEWFKLLGSGARFESITRGVIDLRDLYYYLSIVGVFMALNVYSLERLRWAGNPARSSHTLWRWVVGLTVVNFLAGNLWLQQIGWVRADITQGRTFSISEATRGYLAQAREPLLIRGYFSARTHPLLAPLVPQLRDLIREYAIASAGRVRVEFIDPLEDPALEEEAGRKYGIKPVAFQTTSKYQAAVVNSYFDIVVQYGDQHETLGFRDLIEIQMRGETDIDVALRNPEYDLTRAIKKVLYGYQGGANPFRNLTAPLTFRGFISGPERLPEPLRELRAQLEAVLAEYRAQAGDKLVVELIDPEAEGGARARELEQQYGFRPMAAGLLDPNQFWFYMTLEREGQVEQVPLPEELDPAALKRTIEAALKRFASDALKTIALHAPAVTPNLPQLGMPGSGKRFELLEKQLMRNQLVKRVDLGNGRVPGDVDLLLLVAPEQLDTRAVFAVDQFLMQGGTVVLATSPYGIQTQGSVSAKEYDSGLQDWLTHHGITIEDQLVLDPRNAQFPVPTQRNLGGFVVQEIQLVEYPYFVDIRADGMAQGNAPSAGIAQVTLNWASPITLDGERHQGRTVTELLHSSAQAWVSDSLVLQPDFQAYRDYGFPLGAERERVLLGVMVEGQFDSYFKDRPSPLLAEPEVATDDDVGATDSPPAVPAQPSFAGQIARSSDSARIILFSSNEFLTDDILDLATSATGTRYLNPVELVENAVDWSLEDRGLLTIRSRGHYSRLLFPLERSSQVLWEYLNYAFAGLGLLIVYLVQRRRRAASARRYVELLQAGRE